MKYKVGDTVKIKSIDWYNKNKGETGIIEGKKVNFVPSMSNYCGKTAKITKVDSQIYIYKINIDNGWFCWTDKMFEDMNIKEIVLPEGWEVDKIENNKIILKESKKELPSTWEECCGLLNKGEYINNCSQIHTSLLDRLLTYDYKNRLPIGLGKPMLALCQLLICREVHRQGWKPNPNDTNLKYSAVYHTIWRVVPYTSVNNVFTFQSPEIAEEFLKNFKDLLEQVKDLY